MHVTHIAAPCAPRDRRACILAQQQQRAPTPRASSTHLVVSAPSTSPPPTGLSAPELQRPTPPTPQPPSQPTPLATTPDAAPLTQPGVAATNPPSERGAPRIPDRPGSRRRPGRRVGTKGNLRRWTNQALWTALWQDGPTETLLQTYPQHVLNFAIKDLAAGGHLPLATQLTRFLFDQGAANEYTLAQLFNVRVLTCVVPESPSHLYAGLRHEQGGCGCCRGHGGVGAGGCGEARRPATVYRARCDGIGAAAAHVGGLLDLLLTTFHHAE